MEITAKNVNGMFSEGLWRLKTWGVKSDSRNGPVVMINEPVILTLNKPQERVLFYGERDCNPIFHLLESVHILAGRKDVAFLKQFNSSIGNYSDDGESFNAAYGFRARHHFGEDQLIGVINKLNSDRNTRQAVIQLWDAADLNKQTLDKACNTQLIFSITDDTLVLTVFNRSNDFIWGNTGANAVHFSIWQEFVAAATSSRIGKMRTVSNNLHIYLNLYPKFNHFLDYPPPPDTYDLYSSGEVEPVSIGVTPDNYMKWLGDAEKFCNNPAGFPLGSEPFFIDVAYPMAMVSVTRKSKKGDGMRWVDCITAPDWKIATSDWVERREAKKVA